MTERMQLSQLREAKLDRVCTQLAIAFAIVMLIWTFAVLLLTRTLTIASWDFGIASGFAAIPALVRRGRRIAARNALVTLTNATLFLFSDLFGANTGTHYCFLPATALPFALFPLSRRGSIAYGTLLPLALFCALQTSHFELLPRYEQVPPLTWIYWLTVLSAFALSFLSMFSFARANEKAESLLKASEERYSQIVELAQEGIWVIDMNGITTYVNPRMAAMLGCAPSDMLGRPMQGFMDERTRQQTSGNLARRREGISERFEIRLLRKDGGEVQALVSTSPIRDESGHAVAAIGLILDVTEVRHQERLLEEQRIRMLTAAKLSALGEMAGGIAHEINNPLTALNFRVAVIRNALAHAPIDGTAILENCEKIEGIVLRVAKIIQGLRSFSREESGDPPRVVPVRQVIDDTLSFCRERLTGHGIELQVDSGPPGLQLLCRPVQISQVLLNLLNNAHDALESRESKRVRLEVAELGDQVEIAIADNGPGIPPGIAERIMEPFFTTKDVGKGTGLGLSVSKGIVDSHQGTLTFESSPLETTFRVRLPRHDSRPG